MRLVTYADETGTAVGMRVEGGIAPAGYDDMLCLIRDGEEGLRRAHEVARAGTPRTDVRLLAPVLRPGKLLFCGINYASHKEENPDAVLPEEPNFFSKLPSAVVGPGEPIVLPYPETQVDYEVELALIIGRTAKGISAAAALDHVFGYTVVNDVSARDIQFRPNQLTLGKGVDTFSPMGPELVTADEIPDPQALHVRSVVNGEERQSSSTRQQLFPVALLIETLSALVTLEPGDLISTGTPAGVGTFRTPPLWLRPGDEVTVAVDGIGELTNPVAAGW